MGALDIGERVGLVDADIERAHRDKVEELLGVPDELLPRGDVVEQRRAQEARVLGREAGDGEGRHGARGVAEGDHAALARDAVEADVEGRLADAVEYGDAPLAPRELRDARLDVLVAVVDDVRGAGLRGQLGLRGRRHRADGVGADGAQELAEEQARAARCRVHEDPVALLHGVRLAHERQRRQALQQRRRRRPRLEGLRDLDDARRRRRRVLGVRVLAHVHHAVPDLEPERVALAELDDGPLALAAEDVRELRRLVETRAEVSVDVVRGMLCERTNE